MTAKEQNEFLANAQRKRAQGRGLKNSEISALSRLDRGRDPFARVVTAPLRKPSRPSAVQRTPTTLQAGTDRISPVEHAEEGASGDAAGWSYEEITICESGAPASRWIKTWLSAPS